MILNKSTLKTFQNDSNHLNALIESLESASSASLAAEIIVDFYGLDLEHDDLDEQGFSSSTMGDMLRSAAVKISKNASLPSKRGKNLRLPDQGNKRHRSNTS